MKKITITFIALIITVASAFAFCDHNVKEEKERVEFEKESLSTEHERSIYKLECYLDRTQGFLEIEYAGIGIPDVIIYNSNNVPVHYVRGTSDFGTVTLNLPSVEGWYSVLVQSDVYSGEGTFCVD